MGLLIYEQSTEFVVNASISSLTPGTSDMMSDNNSVSIAYISFSDDDFSTFVPDTSTQSNSSGGSASSGGGGGSVGVASLYLLLLATVYKLANRVYRARYTVCKAMHCWRYFQPKKVD